MIDQPKYKSFKSNLALAFTEILGKDFYISFQIFNNWEDLVPPKIAEKTKPIYFSKGKLFILASTFQWANELRLNSSVLLEKINQNLGEELVTQLEFKQGNIKKFTQQVDHAITQPEYRLTREESDFIEESISHYDESFRGLARKMYTFYFIQKKKEE